MPQQALRTPQLSQKFRLAALPNLKPGDEEYDHLTLKFLEVIQDHAELLLSVTHTEEGCAQNCELYSLEGDSIKYFINKLSTRIYTSEELPAVGTTVPVYVTHVLDNERFFVQKKDSKCDEVQEELGLIGDSQPVLKNIRPNAPCMAKYEDNWYRALIMSKIVQYEATVLFVDYGNESVLDIRGVRQLPKKLLKYPMMALMCSLDGYLPDSNALKALVDSDSVEATVVGVANGKMTVKILNCGRDICSPNEATPPPPSLPDRLIVADDSWSKEEQTSKAGSDASSTSLGRSHHSNPSGEMRRNTIRDRFLIRDSERRRLPDNNRLNAEKTADGYNNHYDSESKNTFRSDRGKRRDDDAVGSGNWRQESNTGAESRNWREHDDRGPRKFGGGDGYRKHQDENSSGSGFVKSGGADGSSRPERPMRTPIRYDERAPAGAEWVDQTLEPNSTSQVQVSYYVSPENFYVHWPSDKDAFVSMVNGIQTDYNNKFSFKKTEPPQESDIVVGKFSEDRVLYRAVVTVADPLTVRFVDYGNIDTIGDGRDVYPVLSKLLDLPKQAIQCRLAGVSPAGEIWSSSADSYFNKDELTCTVVSVEDGVHVVKLSYEGEDVGNQLIAAGLATASDQAGASTISSPKENAKTTEISMSPGVAHIDSKLLAGDVALFNIPFIEGVDRFFVHPDSASLAVLQKLLAEATLSCFVVDPTADNVGKACTVKLDGVLYRAKIAELSEAGALVHFYDYGDLADVSYSEIFSISDSLASFPALAIECALYGDTTAVSDDAQDKFKEQFESKNVVLNIHSVDGDQRLLVTLYDERGVKAEISGWANEEPVACPIPQLVLPATEMTVIVKELRAPNVCLITLPGLSEPDMDTLYRDIELQVEAGLRCAVKCADGCWRRTVRPSDGPCHLLDVGRYEDATEFRPLAPQFVTLPAAVRQVAFTWPMLGQHHVKVCRDEKGITIEPVVKTGYIAHVETVSEMYFQMESVVGKLEDISLALVDTVPAQVDGCDTFAAKFSEDDVWYRAKILSAATPLRVSFIDYGNNADVTELAPLSPALAALPPLARRVDLCAGLPESALDELASLLADAQAPIKLVEQDGKVVDILLDNASIADQILKRRPIAVGAKVIIAHIETPSHFYVHRTEDTSLLEEIDARLAEAASFPLTVAEEGKIVAAIYNEDEMEMWYRARIEADELWFVDHGNRGAMSEIRELPAELLAIPQLAVRMCIDHPSGGQWGLTATDALFGFCTELTVNQVAWREDAFTVSLYSNGENIISSLPIQVDGAEAIAIGNSEAQVVADENLHTSNTDNQDIAEESKHGEQKQEENFDDDEATAVTVLYDETTAVTVLDDEATAVAVPVEKATAVTVLDDEATTVAVPAEIATAVTLLDDEATAVTVLDDEATAVTVLDDETTAVTVLDDETTAVTVSADEVTIGSDDEVIGLTKASDVVTASEEPDGEPGPLIVTCKGTEGMTAVAVVPDLEPEVGNIQEAKSDDLHDHKKVTGEGIQNDLRAETSSIHDLNLINKASDVLQIQLIKIKEEVQNLEINEQHDLDTELEEIAKDISSRIEEIDLNYSNSELMMSPPVENDNNTEAATTIKGTVGGMGAMAHPVVGRGSGIEEKIVPGAICRGVIFHDER